MNRLRSALKLGLNANDINRFLQSDRVQIWLNDLKFTLPGPGGDERERNRYGLSNPILYFLDGDRFQNRG